MLGYCAACELVLSLGFTGAGEIFFFATDAPNALPITACPQCSAALRSETVLSPMAREQREERQLLAELTGEPWRPVLNDHWPSVGFATPKKRALAIDSSVASSACTPKPPAQPSAKMGRPSHCSRELIERICALMREEGLSASRSCERLGVVRTTFSRWRKDPQVRRMIDEAKPAGSTFSAALVMQICETMRRDGLSASAAGLRAGVPPPRLSGWRKAHPHIVPWLDQAAADYARLHPRRGHARPPAPAPPRDWLGRVMAKLNGEAA
ncbi:MAG TPA: transposase [Chthoniobacteraceae bacterium]|jgi:hypothetical protein|nr:transposase [Chthoniobacteraceae bacterium]